MTDAPLRVTTAAVIAAVEAKQPLNLPRRMTPAERAEIARAMQHYMQRDDLVVNEAGALLGLSNREMAHKCAKEIGLKSTQSAIKRVQSAILLHISPEAAERGRLKRWGDQNTELQAKRAERDALDRKVHELRLFGVTRAEIMQRLNITKARLKDACDRMGPVQVQGLPSKWAQIERAQSERAHAKRLEAERMAEELRRLAETMPVAYASRRLGISVRRGEWLAKKHGIKSAVRALPPPRKESPLPHKPKKPRTLPPARERIVFPNDPSKAAPPNPLLTKAQQENVERMKRHTRWLIANTALNLPPPSREEADRLVAEAIAAGKVTRCPTMFAATVNNGSGL